MFEIVLPFRPPLDWEAMTRFLGARAVAGIECVEDGCYRRVVRLGRSTGSLEVRRSGEENAIVASVQLPQSRRAEVERRLRAMFDLDCAPDDVGAVLGRSKILRPALRRHPGIRVPGAWDAFEILVRAIVGQQVSVAGARTILGRIVTRACDGDRPAFPSPAEIAAVDLRGLGMPDRRADNLRSVARAIAEEMVDLNGSRETRRRLLAFPGIGPWTVDYLSMRAFGDRDGFPHGDLVLRRSAGDLTATELSGLAERWRPFRAYAAMLLWASASPR